MLPHRCMTSTLIHIFLSFSSDNLDRTFHGFTRPADGRHRGPGEGGQLPAAEPRCGSDGRHLGRHEGRRADLLRSTGRPEGERSCQRFLTALNQTKLFLL